MRQKALKWANKRFSTLYSNNNIQPYLLYKKIYKKNYEKIMYKIFGTTA